jgi:hypothetical protein
MLKIEGSPQPPAVASWLPEPAAQLGGVGLKQYRARHLQPRKGVTRRDLHICVLRRDGLTVPLPNDDPSERTSRPPKVTRNAI